MGLKSGFNDFGHNLTLVVNCLLLLAVYIVGVGTTAFVAKLTGKHFLPIKRPKQQDSYWEKLDLRTKPADDYYRQF